MGATVVGGVQLGTGKVQGLVTPTKRMSGTVVSPTSVNIKQYVQVFYIEGNINMETMEVSNVSVTYAELIKAAEEGNSVMLRLIISNTEELVVPLVQQTHDSFEFAAMLVIDGELKVLHGTLTSDMALAISTTYVTTPIATTEATGVVRVGAGLLIDDKSGILSVNTTDNASADNTLPMSAAGVYLQLGNINAILETI